MIGRSIAHYRITAKLGEGGMGEVWRANDSQLDREVALKLLPDGFTQDPERLARFEREAKLLAQLNHPNIAQIYGLEASEGTRALVMELVEGPTLAERLESGPLSLNESLSVSFQIAQALEEAHEKGIVHRDLKPQNVKASIEGKVKVLDFGLAKAMDPAGAASGAASASQLAQSPTLTLGATQMGVILGTAAYMSPEQAKGLAVDKRADIWAFGVVLYEMLTGARLFGGETVPETLAGVIRAEIDFGKLPAETPRSIRRLLARCLERDPRRRLRDIGEARVLLERPVEESAGAVSSADGAVSASRWRERAAYAAAIAALAVAGWTLARSGAAPAAQASLPVTRLHLLPPEGLEFNSTDGPVMLSPDGSSIAFRIDEADGRNQLAVRRLDSFEILRLPGTDGAYEPIWSPDGRYVAYFGEQLFKIEAGGLQPPQALAPVSDARGASWSHDGTILFAPAPGSGLSRVSADGGEVRVVTTVDRERGESAHLRPLFLPGDERFLYVVKSERAEVAGLYVGSLDGKLKKRILPLALGARFAEPDILLLVQGDGRLVARRLDLDALELSGEARTIAEGIDYIAQFDLPPVSVSRSGRLVFHRPAKGELRQVRRIDRTGKSLESIGEPGDANLDLSPDGLRLATQRLSADRKWSIWIRDLERGVASRLTGEELAIGPVWSPDGRSIAYAIPEATVPRLMVRPAAGGASRVVLEEPYLIEPIDWSPDGKLILIEVGFPGERSNLLLVPSDGSGPSIPFAKGAPNEHSGRFSPDGAFVAYVSDESGREQIYVEPVTKTGTRWLASPRAGNSPRWTEAGSGDGLELLYVEAGDRAGSSNLMSVAVTRRGAELEFGAAKALGPIASIDYEPVPGGKELLVGSPIEAGEELPPVVIDNWTALLPPR